MIRSMDKSSPGVIGSFIRQQRVALSLSISDLAEATSVSAAHIGRIERGERSPSGIVLQKLSKPLGLKEDDIFMVAGYLRTGSDNAEEKATVRGSDLDPAIAAFLTHEPIEVQRAAIGVLKIIENLAGAVTPPV